MGTSVVARMRRYGAAPLQLFKDAGGRWRSASLRADQAPVPEDPRFDTSGEPGWWDLLPFTTHNIALAGGISTMNGGVDASTDVRTEIVARACGGSLADKTVVDLGCLEGGFTLAFARRGARHALGIEARDVSVQRCNLARDLAGVANAEFVTADIQDELARREPFDVVFATGILYHIGDPAAMLRTMREACLQFVVVDTHVARQDSVSHDCSDVVQYCSNGVEYTGRIFGEYPVDVGDDKKEGLLWAAYSDAEVFWPMEADLVRMMEDAGFVNVEKIDVLDGSYDSPWNVDQTNRVIYVGQVGA